MTLAGFKDILTSFEVDVFHFEAYKATNDYIVWRELEGIGLSGDNQIAESGMLIAVDFYTKQEYSTIPERITKRLELCDEIAVEQPTVVYDEDTKLIHYAWTCEVV